VVAAEPGAALAAVTATDDGFIAVGTTGGPDGDGLVLRSDAAGASWVRVDDPDVLGGGGTQTLSAVNLDADGRLIAGGRDGSSAAVWTRDGRAWHREAGEWDPGGVTAVAASPHGLFAGGYTEDDGGSQDVAVWATGSGRRPDAKVPERGEEPFESSAATLLLSSDHALTAIDLERGTSERVAVDELAGGDPPYRLTRRGDAVVFYGERGDTYAATPAALDAPWRLGSSSYYLPSAEPDRVWLVEGSASTLARNEVREVAIDGRITLEPRLLPAETIPQGAVSQGLVLSDGSGLRVWDPRTEQSVAELPGQFLIAAQGDLLAWCADECENLQISDLSSGTQVLIASPSDSLTWSPQGAFAPSGDRLAVRLGAADRQDAELAVIELNGSITMLETPVAATPITWDPFGRWLFAATADGSLLVHDVEKNRTQLRALDLPTFYGIASVDPMESLGHFAAERGSRGGRLEDGLVLSAGGFESGEVRAVEEGTGRVRWAFDAGDSAFLGPRVDDVVLVAPLYGRLIALAIDTGEPRWSLTLDVSEAAGTPSLANDTVYLPTTYPGEGDTTAPRLHAIDIHTGERRWLTNLEAGTDLQWHQPVLTDELVLLTDTLAHPGSAPTSWLHAIDRATGSIAWRFDLEDDQQGFHFQQPLTNADTVYAVSSGNLFAIDLATGDMRWGRTARRLPELVELTAERLIVVLDGTRQQLDPATGTPSTDR
jgi:outer membrane protein assembly factor BamB